MPVTPSAAHHHAETAHLKYAFMKSHSIVQYIYHFSEDTLDVVLQMMSSTLQFNSKAEVSIIATMSAAWDHKHEYL